MAKKHSKKRHYQKRKREREMRAKSYAENYYKKQMNVINTLKPFAAAAKRLNDRAAQAERDSRNTEGIKQERKYLQ